MSLLYAYSQVQKPLESPLSLKEAKNFLRIDNDLDDELLTKTISAVTTKFENYTGRALIAQDWEVTYRQINKMSISLPIKPVKAIKKIELINYYGSVSEFEIHNIVLDTKLGEVFFKIHPFSYMVRFLYEAGYGETADAVPDDIKSSLLVHIGFLYENRDKIKAFPMDIYDEFKSYRL
ncbi:MAG: head-tail connector protein [Alphaproteobacteria bacterium]|jgi:uncharacterized phiE125 gp8 family phage protein|nr:head-tail connector protein [Candidatus Jidaibacter sp.]